MNPISSSIDQERGKIVPWVIAAFFLSFMLPLIGFAIIAFTHKPSEVTANAYQKGLAYNATLEKAAAQAALGWKAEISLTGNRLRFILKDNFGQPISGAAVDGWLIRPSQQALDHAVPLKEAAKGVYEGDVELPAKGLWNVRVTALAQGKQFQTEKTLTVP
jgi:nitrogen fixation protein FixH